MTDGEDSIPFNITEEEPSTNVCSICSRVFSTARGLKQHFKCCQKKHSPLAASADTTTFSLASSQQELETVPTTVTADATNLLSHIIANVWGVHSSEDIWQIGSSIYEEIVFWRRNVFKLPSGAAGKRYIKETTRLIEIWNSNKMPLADIAIKMNMDMPAVLLQKPSRKSTSKATQPIPKQTS